MGLVYLENSEAIDEALSRLIAWLEAGTNAASGVETFYNTPTERDLIDAVATTIFNAWLRAYARAVFSDEGFAGAFELDPRGMPIRLLIRMVEGRGAGNPSGLASYDPTRQESVYFDELGTEVVETGDELIVAALATALDGLAARSSVAGVGGFGTTDQDAWLWGLRHQVEFPSLLEEYGGASIGALLGGDFSISPADLPLAEGLVAGDPRFGLRGFPRPGDIYAVDAGNPALFGTDYRYSEGPVMRMIIGFVDGAVVGQNVIPGGQSGDPGSPHFVDQTGDWLGNTAIPLRFSVADVIAGAVTREVYSP
jgi:penicillin amidase